MLVGQVLSCTLPVLSELDLGWNVRVALLAPVKTTVLANAGSSNTSHSLRLSACSAQLQVYFSSK